MRDLRYAARSLVRTPGFTLTAVLTLSLSVGDLTWRQYRELKAGLKTRLY